MKKNAQILSLFTTISIHLYAPIQLYADMYKWTDEKGEIHYSDTPPSNEAAPISKNALPTINTLPASTKYKRESRNTEWETLTSQTRIKRNEYPAYHSNISGNLLLDGKIIPLQNLNDVQLKITDETINEEVDLVYKINPEDGSFFIETPNPGQYRIDISIDKNKKNPWIIQAT